MKRMLSPTSVRGFAAAFSAVVNAASLPRLLAILAVFALVKPCGATADPLASKENVLLGIQLVDVAETQQILGKPFDCRRALLLYDPPTRSRIHCRGSETDPLAQPFIDHVTTHVASALISNLIVRGFDRTIFRHDRKRGSGLLGLIDGLYVAGIIAPNATIIHAELVFHPGPTAGSKAP